MKITFVLKRFKNNSGASLCKHWYINVPVRYILISVREKNMLAYINGSVWGAGNYSYKFLLYQYKLVYNCRVIISPNLITINHVRVSNRIIQCDQRGFMQFFLLTIFRCILTVFHIVYSIWCFQSNWESISMPKNLVTYTLSINTLFILMSISGTFHFYSQIPYSGFS